MIQGYILSSFHNNRDSGNEFIIHSKDIYFFARIMNMVSQKIIFLRLKKKINIQYKSLTGSSFFFWKLYLVNMAK